MTEFEIWLGCGIFIFICCALGRRRPHDMNERNLHDLATHSRVQHHKDLSRGSHDK